MAIGNMSKEEFTDVIRRHLSPSAPIQSYENLRGRQEQLDNIERALLSPGRHIFIYGDRGVGKTSLAQTAAYRHQSSDNEPIKLACEKDTTLTNLVSYIAKKTHDKYYQSKTSQKISGEIKIDGLSLSHEKQKGYDISPIPQITDINSAIDVMKQIQIDYSKQTLVIIDEFDLLENKEERIRFANFIKQLGDQNVNVQFIFCGIGNSINDLFAGHKSVHRYVENIRLPQLGWDGRFDIIDYTADAFGISVDKGIRYRIAAISDGFPYYIHLILTNLYWELYNDPNICTLVERNHFVKAINSTTKGIEAYLRTAYDDATMKDSNDYHEVLWAVADHTDLRRQYKDIYESYERIMGVLGNPPISKDKFSNRLNSLRGDSCGRILVSHKRTWYEFRENIIRGYVRLRAEEQGVELELNYTAPNRTPGQTMRVKSRADASIYKGRFSRYQNR